MKNHIALLPLAFGVALAGPALADTPIHQDRTVAADATINISNVSGTITVSGWDRPRVEVTGSLGAGSGGLDIHGDTQHLSIKVKGPKASSSGWFGWGSNTSMAPSELDVHVPRGATLDIHTVSANVRVSAVRGGNVQINDVSGRIAVDAQAPSIKVQGVSGRVRLDGRYDKADLQTVSGDIHAPHLGPAVSVQTVSGEIAVGGGPFDSFTASTVSGDIAVTGGMRSDGHMDIDSMSGDVNLSLPATAPVSLHAATFSGDIHSDIGSVQHRAHGPGASLDARAGQNGGSIRVKTFSGDVHVLRDRQAPGR